MANLISDLYRQNEWANLRLLEVCGDLTDEQLDATAVGTYGSIRDTLVHIAAAEAGYAFRLGGDESRRIQYDGPWPGFDLLTDTARYAADTFIEAATAIGDDPIRGGPPESQWEYDAGVVLVQAFHHSTEHRSQIATILTTLGIEPPELSSWEWAIAEGRMRRVEDAH
jgi:uncharacterized damage-inducible protein DinB